MHFSRTKFSTVVIRTIVLLCLLLGAGVAYARLTGYELLSVQTGSMRPLMKAGDVVLINTHDKDVQLGDVVSYASPLNPHVTITHRVIGIDEHRGIISTKGDNAALPDEAVPAWNLHGTVRRVLPHIGWLLNLLKHPLGLVVVVYVPVLGIIISEIRRLQEFYRTGASTARMVHYRLHPQVRISRQS